MLLFWEMREIFCHTSISEPAWFIYADNLTQSGSSLTSHLTTQPPIYFQMRTHLAQSVYTFVL